VGSGQAALERLAQHVDDLIVCDLHLPDVWPGDLPRDRVAVLKTATRRPLPARRVQTTV
jgi:CheY-like chemotaxis protein